MSTRSISENTSGFSTPYSDDSLSEELSPPNGYFQPQSIPQSFFAADGLGSRNAMTPEDPKQHHVSEHVPPTQSTQVHPHSSRGYWDGERYVYTRQAENAPLLAFTRDQPPPPTYASIMSPSSRTYEYRRLSNDGNGLPEDEERADFLPNDGGRAPQSMSDMRTARYESDTRSIFVRIWQRQWWTLERIAIAIGTSLATIILLATIAFATSSRPPKTVVLPDPADASPVLDEPIQARPPAVPVPPNEIVLWPSHCGAQQQPKEFDFSYDQTEFRFSETIEGTDHSMSGIFGEIHVMPAPGDQATDIQVKFSVTSSAPIEVNDLITTTTPYALEVDGVDYEPPNTAGTFCMRLDTTIWLRPELTLDNLDIDSRNMKADIHDGINMTVNGLTTITLAKGSLKSSLFTSRQTTVEIGSGSISGEYSLLDRLVLRTESGPIDVDVKPGEKDPDKPKPALFSAHSHSGSIKARVDTFALPERDYQTQIESGMGSIEATLVHGSETEVKATSGSIKVDVTPYRAGNDTSKITTSTMSGSTRFNLLAPHANPGTALNEVHSTHDGKSGSMTITYPQEWTGRLSGGTLSGRLTLSGRDLENIKYGNGGRVAKQVTANKGSGNSDLTVNTMSGSCKIRVGDL